MSVELRPESGRLLEGWGLSFWIKIRARRPFSKHLIWFSSFSDEEAHTEEVTCSAMQLMGGKLRQALISSVLYLIIVLKMRNGIKFSSLPEVGVCLTVSSALQLRAVMKATFVHQYQTWCLPHLWCVNLSETSILKNCGAPKNLLAWIATRKKWIGKTFF